VPCGGAGGPDGAAAVEGGGAGGALVALGVPETCCDAGVALDAAGIALDADDVMFAPTGVESCSDTEVGVVVVVVLAMVRVGWGAFVELDGLPVVDGDKSLGERESICTDEACDGEAVVEDVRGGKDEDVDGGEDEDEDEDEDDEDESVWGEDIGTPALWSLSFPMVPCWHVR